MHPLLKKILDPPLIWGKCWNSRSREYQALLPESTNHHKGKIRKRLKAETWVKLAKHPEEIQRTPNDIMAQVTQQHSNLSTTVEERAAELCDEIHHELAHTGKEFHDVGKIRQQSGI